MEKVVIITVLAFILLGGVAIHSATKPPEVIEVSKPCPPPEKIEGHRLTPEKIEAQYKHLYCVICCEDQYWELGKEPKGQSPLEPVYCVEHCLRVAEALAYNYHAVIENCKVIANGY